MSIIKNPITIYQDMNKFVWLNTQEIMVILKQVHDRNSL